MNYLEYLGFFIPRNKLPYSYLAQLFVLNALKLRFSFQPFWWWILCRQIACLLQSQLLASHLLEVLLIKVTIGVHVMVSLHWLMHGFYIMYIIVFESREIICSFRFYFKSLTASCDNFLCKKYMVSVYFLFSLRTALKIRKKKVSSGLHPVQWNSLLYTHTENIV